MYMSGRHLQVSRRTSSASEVGTGRTSTHGPFPKCYLIRSSLVRRAGAKGRTLTILRRLGLRAVALFAACVLVVGSCSCGGAGPTAAATSPTAARVDVSPRASQIFVGASQQFTAVVTDASGNPLTGVPITWFSDPSSVAGISSRGMASGVAGGTARIVAVAPGGLQGSAVLTVQGTFNVLPSSAHINVGGSQQFAPVGADGNPLDGVPINWSSDAPSVAAVNASGLASGVSGGTAHIMAIGPDGISCWATLTVAPVLAGVTVSPDTLSVQVGGTQQFTVIAYDTNGNVMTGVIVVWSVDNPQLGTVNQNGLFTALAPGSLTLTAAVSQLASSDGTPQVIRTVSSSVPPGRMGETSRPESRLRTF